MHDVLRAETGNKANSYHSIHLTYQMEKFRVVVFLLLLGLSNRMGLPGGSVASGADSTQRILIRISNLRFRIRYECLRLSSVGKKDIPNLVR